jgi:hypothetical protein
MAANTQPIAVIAGLLDLTERRVQQLVRQGVIPRGERGRYDLVGAVRGYVRFLREQATRAQGGEVDFSAERARLIKAKADLAEMEAALRRGELVPAQRVEQAWTAVLARLRARLLVLPDRLAPLVHEEATLSGARALIRRTIFAALSELAAIPIETADDAIAPDPDGTAAASPGGKQGAGDLDAAAGAHAQ